MAMKFDPTLIGVYVKCQSI